MGCDELHAAFGRGENDSGVSSQAGGGGEEQDAGAGISVVGSCEEAAGGRYRREQEIELVEELLVLAAESCMTLAKVPNFAFAQGRAPCEAGRDGGIEFVKVAGM